MSSQVKTVTYQGQELTYRPLTEQIKHTDLRTGTAVIVDDVKDDMLWLGNVTILKEPDGYKLEVVPKKLKKGDTVAFVNYYQGKLRQYRELTVERTTATQAVLDNGTRLKIEYDSDYSCKKVQFTAIGARSDLYYLPDENLKAEHDEYWKCVTLSNELAPYQTKGEYKDLLSSDELAQVLAIYKAAEQRQNAEREAKYKR